MRLDDIPFTQTRWEDVPVTEHAGDTGTARWRTVQHTDDSGAPCLRIRMVEYSPGYSADHWCTKGHVVLVLRGEIETRLKDGRVFVTRAGESWHAGDNMSEHRSSTRGGATLFIVD